LIEKSGMNPRCQDKKAIDGSEGSTPGDTAPFESMPFLMKRNSFPFVVLIREVNEYLSD